MKKIVSLLFSLFLATTCITYGQDGKSKDKIGGIRAGWHYATLIREGSKPDTANHLNSFYVGIYRDNRLARIMYLGTGLEYFQNGLSYTNNSKRVLHTLSVPLNLKLKLGPFYALGGIAANFKVSEKLVIGDDRYDPLESQKFHWFDAPLFLGAGVKILFIKVEARYHWGTIEARDQYHIQYFQLGLSF